MSHTKLGPDARLLVATTNQTIKLCAEDADHCKNQLKTFLKDNKDRFTEKDVAILLDMWDSLDLMEERLKTANVSRTTYIPQYRRP